MDVQLNCRESTAVSGENSRKHCGHRLSPVDYASQSFKEHLMGIQRCCENLLRLQPGFKGAGAVSCLALDGGLTAELPGGR